MVLILTLNIKFIMWPTKHLKSRQICLASNRIFFEQTIPVGSSIFPTSFFVIIYKMIFRANVCIWVCTYKVIKKATLIVLLHLNKEKKIVFVKIIFSNKQYSKTLSERVTGLYFSKKFCLWSWEAKKLLIYINKYIVVYF